MSTDSITVSLDVARKLRDAGWEQKNFFWVAEGRSGYSDKLEHPPIGEWYAAPTAEEILRELPKWIIDKRKKDMTPLVIRKARNGEWYIEYHLTFNAPLARLKVDTLANAAAEIWIYLKENNLLPTKNET